MLHRRACLHTRVNLHLFSVLLLALSSRAGAESLQADCSAGALCEASASISAFVGGCQGEQAPRQPIRLRVDAGLRGNSNGTSGASGQLLAALQAQSVQASADVLTSGEGHDGGQGYTAWVSTWTVAAAAAETAAAQELPCALLLASKDLNWADVLPAVRNRVARYGSKLVGLPYTVDAPVVLYRRDVLQQRGEAVPETWPELVALLRRLQDRAGAPSPSSGPTAGFCNLLGGGDCSRDPDLLVSVWASVGLAAMPVPRTVAELEAVLETQLRRGAMEPGLVWALTTYRELMAMAPAGAGHGPCSRPSLEVALAQCAVVVAPSSGAKAALWKLGSAQRAARRSLRLGGDGEVEQRGRERGPERAEAQRQQRSGHLGPAGGRSLPRAARRRALEPSAAGVALVAPLPGSVLAAHPDTGVLTSCQGGAVNVSCAYMNPQQLPYAVTPLHGDAAGAAMGATTRPRSAVTRAVYLGSSVYALQINASAPLLHQYAVWRAAAAVLGPAQSWPAVLDPSEGSPTPLRASQLLDVSPWVSHGYNRADAMSYLEAQYDSLTTAFSFTALWLPPGPAAQRLSEVLARSANDAAFGNRSATDIARETLADLLSLYVANEDAVLDALMHQVGGQHIDPADLPGNSTSPTPPPPGTVASNAGADGGLSSGSIAGIVLGCVLGTAALLVFALALWARSGALVGGLRRRLRFLDRSTSSAPGFGPDTTLLLTDVQDSTSLWEQLPTHVMDASLSLHNGAFRQLLPRFGGYECHTEGDSFVLAFHSAVEAAAFALELQVVLLDLSWPQALLDHELAGVVLQAPLAQGSVDGTVPASGGAGQGLSTLVSSSQDMPLVNVASSAGSGMALDDGLGSGPGEGGGGGSSAGAGGPPSRSGTDFGGASGADEPWGLQAVDEERPAAGDSAEQLANILMDPASMGPGMAGSSSRPSRRLPQRARTFSVSDVPHLVGPMGASRSPPGERRTWAHGSAHGPAAGVRPVYGRSQSGKSDSLLTRRTMSETGGRAMEGGPGPHQAGLQQPPQPPRRQPTPAVLLPPVVPERPLLPQALRDAQRPRPIGGQPHFLAPAAARLHQQEEGVRQPPQLLLQALASNTTFDSFSAMDAAASSAAAAAAAARALEPHRLQLSAEEARSLAVFPLEQGSQGPGWLALAGVVPMPAQAQGSPEGPKSRPQDAGSERRSPPSVAAMAAAYGLPLAAGGQAAARLERLSQSSRRSGADMAAMFGLRDEPSATVPDEEVSLRLAPLQSVRGSLLGVTTGRSSTTATGQAALSRASTADGGVLAGTSGLLFVRRSTEANSKSLRLGLYTRTSTRSSAGATPQLTGLIAALPASLGGREAGSQPLLSPELGAALSSLTRRSRRRRRASVDAHTGGGALRSAAGDVQPDTASLSGMRGPGAAGARLARHSSTSSALSGHGAGTLSAAHDGLIVVGSPRQQRARRQRRRQHFGGQGARRSTEGGSSGDGSSDGAGDNALRRGEAGTSTGVLMWANGAASVGPGFHAAANSRSRPPMDLLREVSSPAESDDDSTQALREPACTAHAGTSAAADPVAPATQEAAGDAGVLHGYVPWQTEPVAQGLEATLRHEPAVPLRVLPMPAPALPHPPPAGHDNTLPQQPQPAPASALAPQGRGPAPGLRVEVGEGQAGEPSQDAPDSLEGRWRHLQRSSSGSNSSNHIVTVCSMAIANRSGASRMLRSPRSTAVGSDPELAERRSGDNRSSSLDQSGPPPPPARHSPTSTRRRISASSSPSGTPHESEFVLLPRDRGSGRGGSGQLTLATGNGGSAWPPGWAMSVSLGLPDVSEGAERRLPALPASEGIPVEQQRSAIVRSGPNGAAYAARKGMWNDLTGASTVAVHSGEGDSAGEESASYGMRPNHKLALSSVSGAGSGPLSVVSADGAVVDSDRGHASSGVGSITAHRHSTSVVRLPHANASADSLESSASVAATAAAANAAAANAAAVAASGAGLAWPVQRRAMGRSASLSLLAETEHGSGLAPLAMSSTPAGGSVAASGPGLSRRAAGPSALRRGGGADYIQSPLSRAASHQFPVWDEGPAHPLPSINVLADDDAAEVERASAHVSLGAGARSWSVSALALSALHSQQRPSSPRLGAMVSTAGPSTAPVVPGSGPYTTGQGTTTLHRQSDASPVRLSQTHAHWPGQANPPSQPHTPTHQQLTAALAAAGVRQPLDRASGSAASVRVRLLQQAVTQSLSGRADEPSTGSSTSSATRRRKSACSDPGGPAPPAASQAHAEGPMPRHMATTERHSGTEVDGACGTAAARPQRREPFSAQPPFRGHNLGDSTDPESGSHYARLSTRQSHTGGQARLAGGSGPGMLPIRRPPRRMPTSPRLSAQTLSSYLRGGPAGTASVSGALVSGPLGPRASVANAFRLSMWSVAGAAPQPNVAGAGGGTVTHSGYMPGGAPVSPSRPGRVWGGLEGLAEAYAGPAPVVGAPGGGGRPSLAPAQPTAQPPPPVQPQYQHTNTPFFRASLGGRWPLAARGLGRSGSQPMLFLPSGDPLQPLAAATGVDCRPLGTDGRGTDGRGSSSRAGLPLVDSSAALLGGMVLEGGGSGGGRDSAAYSSMLLPSRDLGVGGRRESSSNTSRLISVLGAALRHKRHSLASGALPGDSLPLGAGVGSSVGPSSLPSGPLAGLGAQKAKRSSLPWGSAAHSSAKTLSARESAQLGRSGSSAAPAAAGPTTVMEAMLMYASGAPGAGSAGSGTPPSAAGAASHATPSKVSPVVSRTRSALMRGMPRSLTSKQLMRVAGAQAGSPGAPPRPSSYHASRSAARGMLAGRSLLALQRLFGHRNSGSDSAHTMSGPYSPNGHGAGGHAGSTAAVSPLASPVMSPLQYALAGGTAAASGGANRAALRAPSGAPLPSVFSRASPPVSFDDQAAGEIEPVVTRTAGHHGLGTTVSARSATLMSDGGPGSGISPTTSCDASVPARTVSGPPRAFGRASAEATPPPRPSAWPSSARPPPLSLEVAAGGGPAGALPVPEHVIATAISPRDADVGSPRAGLFGASGPLRAPGPGPTPSPAALGILSSSRKPVGEDTGAGGSPAPAQAMPPRAVALRQQGPAAGLDGATLSMNTGSSDGRPFSSAMPDCTLPLDDALVSHVSALSTASGPAGGAAVAASAGGAAGQGGPGAPPPASVPRTLVTSALLATGGSAGRTISQPLAPVEETSPTPTDSPSAGASAAAAPAGDGSAGVDAALPLRAGPLGQGGQGSMRVLTHSQLRQHVQVRSQVRSASGDPNRSSAGYLRAASAGLHASGRGSAEEPRGSGGHAAEAPRSSANGGAGALLVRARQGLRALRTSTGVTPLRGPEGSEHSPARACSLRALDTPNTSSRFSHPWSGTGWSASHAEASPLHLPLPPLPQGPREAAALPSAQLEAGVSSAASSGVLPSVAVQEATAGVGAAHGFSRRARSARTAMALSAAAAAAANALAIGGGAPRSSLQQRNVSELMGCRRLSRGGTQDLSQVALATGDSDLNSLLPSTSQNLMLSTQQNAALTSHNLLHSTAATPIANSAAATQAGVAPSSGQAQGLLDRLLDSAGAVSVGALLRGNTGISGGRPHAHAAAGFGAPAPASGQQPPLSGAAPSLGTPTANPGGSGAAVAVPSGSSLRVSRGVLAPPSPALSVTAAAVRDNVGASPSISGRPRSGLFGRASIKGAGMEGFMSTIVRRLDSLVSPAGPATPSAAGALATAMAGGGEMPAWEAAAREGMKSRQVSTAVVNRLGGGGGGAVVPASTASRRVSRKIASGLPGGPEPAVCFRGFRVRCGMHSGLDPERDVYWTKVSGRRAYSGPAMALAKAVSDLVPGGMVVLTQATWDRLQPWPPTDGLPGAIAWDRGRFRVGLCAADPETPSITVELRLFQLLCPQLLPRQPHLERRPWRGAEQVLPGVLSAPLGRLAIVKVQVVGVQVLAAWDAEVTADALRVFGSVVGDVLPVWGGFPAYLETDLDAAPRAPPGPAGAGATESVRGRAAAGSAEGAAARGCGTLVAAFREPAMALGFLHALLDVLVDAPWPEPLLAHELGEPLALAQAGGATPPGGGGGAATPPGAGAEAAAGGLEVQPPSPLPSVTGMAAGGASAPLAFRGLRLRCAADVASVKVDLGCATAIALYEARDPKAFKQLRRMLAAAHMGEVLCSGALLAEVLSGPPQAVAALHDHLAFTPLAPGGSALAPDRGVPASMAFVGAPPSPLPSFGRRTAVSPLPAGRSYRPPLSPVPSMLQWQQPPSPLPSVFQRQQPPSPLPLGLQRGGTSPLPSPLLSSRGGAAAAAATGGGPSGAPAVALFSPPLTRKEASRSAIYLCVRRQIVRRSHMGAAAGFPMAGSVGGVYAVGVMGGACGSLYGNVSAGHISTGGTCGNTPQGSMYGNVAPVSGEGVVGAED
ncbi:hypothetical protein HYH03_005638 [Edaphochlamys debaryana]|uniref:Guanylate cyclase domain-containing protein n=1 Tax=Edaphochlamys debaryana TaxID=47281 RepID=A0A835Y4T4_9CHLO|nr:hypothetical protein HYH03_005638 [Edaphochlamys debaryana]|eukprot:KAG2496412.1 hypothetical protein HYH03_005638 [Edaphochlamys debaryana]